jgi:hypothetical protein
LGKIHGEPTGAEIMPELLPEQHFYQSSGYDRWLPHPA